MSHNTEELKKLIRNRGSIKQKLSILDKFITNSIKTTLPDKKASLSDVELRYKNGLSLLKEFNEVQLTIEALCREEDLEIHYEERECFEEKYYATQDFLVQYINSENNKNTITSPQSLNQNIGQVNPSSTNPNVNSNFDSLNNVLLPKIKLPSHASKMHLVLNNSSNSTIKCNFCKQNHTIYKCEEFLKLSVNERIINVSRLKLCKNCLRTGHNENSCTLLPCKICKTHNKILKHNTLLHIENKSQDVELQGNQENVNMLVRPSFSSHSQVLLCTILCKIQDIQGNFHQCRALLDCGAQSHMITENFCNKLNINCVPTNLSIIGINQIVSKLNKKCTLTIFSNSSDFSCTISCFVTPIITSNIPSYHVNIGNWNLPDKVQLADPSFNISKEVDLLIGAGLFWDLILEGKIKLGENLPTLQNTHFGYIVTGNAPMNINLSVCNFSKVYVPEDDQLRKFWELEEVKVSVPFTNDDLECEKLFEKDTFRNNAGQFVVKFPLKQSPSVLGNSKEVAIKRLVSLEKKFTDSNFKALYFDFMREYENLKHMTKLPDDLHNRANAISYFLPHHGVVKEHNVTTKLRTVFDGSCPTSTGWSLNDIQYIGPKVQNDIIDILLRFRIYDYVVSADVSKMYRCILMHPDHRPLQQILWRENPADDISVYQLNTVSYGTSSAPYLAIKCLRKLAEENREQFPQACQTILDDFYVDDLLTGSNNLSELKTRCKEIYSILESGHFVLRKWVSNEPQVISDLNHSAISNSTLTVGKNESCKTLGIQWLTYSDTLQYNIKPFNSNNSVPVTKRHILSTIAQIYDPLGCLSPVIVTSKIIIQRLWSLRISWDDIIPPDLEKNFLQFQTSLSKLGNLSIPRSAIPRGFELFDVHCFCDASKDAYASCVYLRSKNINGDFEIHLLCAKSKVAPLKTITIPKLELCACLLGAQLINVIKNALSLSVPIFMWSDSQVALSWIQTEPNLLQVFVSNRVCKIQSLTELNNWRYINTKENPADLASRGVTAETLLKSSIWWTGPQFLKEHNFNWSSTHYSIPSHELPELKKKAVLLSVTSVEFFDLFTKYSNLRKLQRVTAFCIRFFDNLKNKKYKTKLQIGPLTVSELEHANDVLLKIAQVECFSTELKTLSTNSYLDKNNKISSLTPFIDEKGLLRVGGRLKNTYLPFGIKHPILLHSNHPLTKLIFEHKHKYLLHPGPQLLLASVRQYYWPVGGRNLAKKIVRNCLTCFRFNPISSVSPMSSLPDSRIKPSYPFQTTGLDYAGPFFILNKPGKGARLIKCYLAIFVCFCTKAIHIEIILNLTTESFIACLKRFTSRRGLPSTIYSDNGSTFVGANNELKNLGNFLHKNQDSIVNSTSNDRIHWIFIPPYTPNFGGLWESAVKSCKHHLKRVLINHNLTYEEFNTLIIQVEGILNSRPLFSMSNDPNDLIPITPSHFLIGRSLQHVPEPHLQDLRSNRLPRLQHVQKLNQQFWSQFSKHYISQLHAQYKWKESPTKIKDGTLVLLRNDKQPPYKWPVGRIVQQFPSKDGTVRVVDVLTSSGRITRSVRHVCPLPFQDEIDC